MKVQLNRDGEFIDLAKITIKIDDVDFRLSLNNFGDLVINKWQNGGGSGSISIIPNVSNEIIIQ